MRIIFLSLVVLGISGCCLSPTYQQTRSPAVMQPRLSMNASALIGVSSDGDFLDEHYEGSGQATTQAILGAFGVFLLRAEVLSKKSSLEEGVEEAKLRGITHYVHPTIVHWEERATEWSGKPDRIEVRIQIIEVNSGGIVDTVTLSGKSKWFTFGGDHPEELLNEPLRQYATELCGSPLPPQ